MTDALVTIHAAMALAILPAFALAALWGLFDYRRGAGLSRRYDHALWAFQAILIVQVLTGVAAILLDRWPAYTAHLALGSTAALLPWLGWQVARRTRRVSLCLALTCATVLILALAAILTAT